MKPNQLSNTAAFIAVKFYGLTRDEPYRSLFDDEVIRFYEQLVQRLPPPLRYYYSGLKNRRLRTFFKFWEELLLPGDLMHILLRKWYLTKWIDTLAEQGYKQMLVLGAGFDHLAALNAKKGIKSVELDTPKMIALKNDVITHGGYTSSDLHLQKAFFSHDSLDAILKAELDLHPKQKTVVVAEGFFDYFNRATCSEILRELQAYFTGGLSLLSTLFSLDELSGSRSFVYRNSIKLAGEELKLELDRPGFEQFLKDHHFKIEKVRSPENMNREVLLPHAINYPVLKGFYLFKTERSR